IIVCARNEEENLLRLLPALAQQNYPLDKLEICLVDDRSTDRTRALLQAFVTEHSHAKYFRIEDTRADFAPKKRALDNAIRHSTGEIIVLTDADGVPGPNWVAEIVTQFEDGVAMVCGYSPYHPRANLWQNILALEYFSLAAVAAGSIGAERPLTCTGSNLAYRRSAYFAINGFEGIAHWISGDDDLLLHKMHEQRVGQIKFVAHAAAHVPVHPPRSWKELQARRTRYASKGRHYKLGVSLALAAVYLLNLFLCGGILAASFGEMKIFFFTVVCGLSKAGFEFFYLKQAAQWFGEEDVLRYFPLAALVHPFYVVYFSTRAQFAGFSWRGEAFAARANNAAQA
ncbi:MAG: glycosyltransferase, partial [candidate division KSB1 bacterium]